MSFDLSQLCFSSASHGVVDHLVKLLHDKSDRVQVAAAVTLLAIGASHERVRHVPVRRALTQYSNTARDVSTSLVDPHCLATRRKWTQIACCILQEQYSPELYKPSPPGKTGAAARTC